MNKHTQTQSEWENEMARKILELTRDELFLNLPHLSIALNSLEFYPKEDIETLATNGQYLYYSSTKIISLFKKNPKFLNRAYLHSIFHCLFSQLWIRQDKNINLWNIACDISVEYTIDSLHCDCTKRILSLLRQEVYKKINTEANGFSAAAIYMWLLNQENIESIQLEFNTDDHRFWPKETKDNQSPMPNDIQQNWDKIARQTLLNQKKKGKENDEQSSSLLNTQIQAAKQKRSYKNFLRQFSITKEEVHLDMDEFDLSYYTYGLDIYKNMPLIEPLESKEVRKIEEFVIVIDTSYSTNGTLVKNFLKETYTILCESNSFFKKNYIHIIQCDDTIQKDDLITNQDQMNQLLNQFTLVGGGNTDFRPAFQYVNALIQEKKIKNLSGLIYFTDGKGIYPKRRPDYKCAFIYLDTFDKDKVPPWAITLQVNPMEWKGK